MNDRKPDSSSSTQVSLQPALEGNEGDVPRHKENTQQVGEEEEGHVVDIQPAAARTDDDAPAIASIDATPKPQIDHRRIYRVSRHLRENGRNQQLYDPRVLSIGPYHHGKEEYLQTELIKDKVLHSFLSESQEKDETKDRKFFSGQIIDNIGAIRKNYEEVEFTDEYLAAIILRDACFLITYMRERFDTYTLINDHFGKATYFFMERDLFVLENQIPFWVIKLLLDLRFDEDKADKIIRKFLCLMCNLVSKSTRLTTLPWKDKPPSLPPLHLLEARGTTYFLTCKAADQHFLIKFATESTKICKKFLKMISKSCEEICNEIWKMISKRCEEMFKKIQKSSTDINRDGDNNGSDSDSNELSTQEVFEWLNLPCRSVTYLQAKGIFFQAEFTMLTRY